MPSMHDPESSPRLDRLFRAAANRTPAGLTDRLHAASAPLLPGVVLTPPVLHRIGFRWLAAAAALLLAAGLSLRLVHPADPGSLPELTVAMVVQGSDGSPLGEEIVAISGVRDTRLSDLDDEMNQLLADARIDG